MAKNVEITFKIEGVEYSVDQLNQMAKAAGKVSTEADDAANSTKKLGDEAKKAGDEIKKTGEEGEGAIKVVDEATGGLATKVKEVGGGLVQMGKKAWTALMSMVKGSRLAAGALAATGIGAIVVAVGLLVSYWDDILGAVNGTSRAARANLEATEDTATAAQDALSALEASENSLKLQGKSEKEIRDLKIQQTNETITALEAQLAAQETIKKEQIEGARRNKAILSGILQAISLPITAILKAYDYIMGTNTVDQVFGSIANLAFNPDEIAEEGQAAIDETSKQLQALKNKRDGFLLQEKDANKKAAEDRKAARDKELEDAQSVEQKLAELRVQSLKDQAEKIHQEFMMQRTAAEEELKAKGATEEQLLQLSQYYDQLEQAALDAYNKEVADKQAQADKEALDKKREQQQALANISEEYYQAGLETDAERELRNIDLAEAARIKELQDLGKYEELKYETTEYYANLRQKVRETEEMAALQSAANILGDIADVAGEGTAVAQAAGVAQAYINTYLAASQALADPTIPTALKPFAVAAIIAGGLKNVTAIMNTEKPETPKAAFGGMVVGPSHAAGGVPIEAEGGEFIINKAAMAVPGVAQMAAGLNSIARPQYANGGMVSGIDSMNQLLNTPIKTYVVATEMTTTQEANRNIERLARL